MALQGVEILPFSWSWVMNFSSLDWFWNWMYLYHGCRILPYQACSFDKWNQITLVGKNVMFKTYSTSNCVHSTQSINKTVFLIQKQSVSLKAMDRHCNVHKQGLHQHTTTLKPSFISPFSTYPLSSYSTTCGILTTDHLRLVDPLRK